MNKYWFESMGLYLLIIAGVFLPLVFATGSWLVVIAEWIFILGWWIYVSPRYIKWRQAQQLR